MPAGIHPDGRRLGPRDFVAFASDRREDPLRTDTANVGSAVRTFFLTIDVGNGPRSGPYMVSRPRRLVIFLVIVVELPPVGLFHVVDLPLHVFEHLLLKR